MKMVIISILITLVALYTGLLAYLYFNQRNMIYLPDNTRPEIVEGAEEVNVTTSDGLTLAGWYFPSQDQAKPVILHFQGNAGNRSDRVWKAHLLQKEGYGVLLAGYRGYGENPGSISEEGLLNDGRAYVEYLLKQGKKIALHGESLGTGVATRMASEYPIAGLILESPYSSIVDVAKSMYFFVPVELLLKDRFESTEAIKNVTAPKLIIHGGQDRTIPIRFGRKLFEAAPEPKTFVSLDSAAHNDLYDHGAALHVFKFLSTISGPEKD